MANRASRYGPGSQSENTPMDNVLMHHRNYFDIKAWQILMQSALDFQINLARHCDMMRCCVRYNMLWFTPGHVMLYDCCCRIKVIKTLCCHMDEKQCRGEVRYMLLKYQLGAAMGANTMSLSLLRMQSFTTSISKIQYHPTFILKTSNMAGRHCQSRADPTSNCRSTQHYHLPSY